MYAALASQMSDADSVGGLVSSLLDVLSGKAAGGKPKTAGERLGVLAAVAALAAAPGSGSAIAAVADLCVQRLLDAYQAEPTEEVSRPGLPPYAVSAKAAITQQAGLLMWHMFDGSLMSIAAFVCCHRASWRSSQPCAPGRRGCSSCQRQSYPTSGPA